MLSAVASDVRFGLRLYRRSPRFYGLLLVVLVVGIASTTAMFSILDTLILRPLPFSDPERLVMLQSKRPEANRHAISYPHFEAMRAGARSVTALAVAHSWLHALSSEGAVPEGVVGTLVSGEFFQMLGIRPLLGRLIEPADDAADAEPVVVIGEQLWQRRFQADPNVIGRRVLLDGRAHTIVGVTPARFDFSYPGMEQSSVWTVPEALRSPVWFDATSSGRDWYAMARLAPGVSREDAAAELEALAARADPDGSLRRTGVELKPLHEAITGDTVDTVWLRFGAIGMAFVVACANVSNLLLVRTESRRAELAARAALGASRRRLVQQLMTETLLLFALAVPLGALCTRWLVQLFASVTVAPKSALSHVDSIDLRAFWFCVLVCLGAGLTAGLLPAVAASRVDLLSVLKNGGAESRTGGSGGPRAALVVAQVALAFALLSSGGLALMRVNELLSTPLGYEPSGVVDLRLIGLPDDHRESGQARALLDRVLAKIADMPQVEAVGAGGAVPLTGYDAITNVGIEGRANTAPLEFVSYNTITRGYLDVMHIPLLRGRLFNADDERGGEPVALINESLASSLFPGQDPIGQRITHPTVEGPLARTIVGVVGDLRREGPSGPYTNDTYAPLRPGAGMPGVIVVRTSSPEQVRRELPQVIASVEPRLGTWMGTLHRRVRNAASDSINVSILLGSFAAITLLLAALGLYAMVSYATVLKTRELGIRSALGSPPGAVLWLVMRSGLWWLAIGSGLGLVAALLLGQTLASRMPGAQSFDLRVYVLVGASLLGAGSLAAFLPARRAVRASPALALRYE